MPKLLRASDVTVLPSIWSEPFGRIAIESMACETPVVASRVGGIPEILTGEFAEGLFEPGSSTDLAMDLARLRLAIVRSRSRSSRPRPCRGLLQSEPHH